jgi:hypothetical protein
MQCWEGDDALVMEVALADVIADVHPTWPSTARR